MSSVSDLYEDIASALPESAAGALELISIPHWVDDDLAGALSAAFGASNGTTAAAIAAVKALPFVAPHGRHEWGLAGPARSHFHARVQLKTDLYSAVNEYLADHFGNLSLRFDSRAAPLAREADWRSLYHLAPGAPKAALDGLTKFADNAASTNRLSDLKAAADLTELRRPAFTGFEAEVSYVLGRYAYARDDWVTAEAHFSVVWENDADLHRRLVSGHLLGVIWASKSRQPWWGRAEIALREAAELARRTGDRRGEAMVLTTLGTVLSRLGGAPRFDEAERALRRSLELWGHNAGSEAAFAMSSLASVLIRGGSRAQLIEAETLLREAHELAGDAGESMVDRLAQVLLRLGHSARLAEAEALLQSRLRVGAVGMDRAITLNTLAAVLLKKGGSGDLRDAEAAIGESIEIGRQSKNPRHVAMALLTGSWIAERRGDTSLAIARQEEMIEVNRELGLTREVERAQARLLRLRRPDGR
jgi:tetratricopeptide (TPR) repeat protein